MKKIKLATIIISIGMSLVGCNNSTTLNNGNETNKKVTIEQAKEIALKHANLINDQVSFIRTETDLDKGVEKYDIEFYYENKEYDYEINGADGQIISYDYDVENYDIPNEEESNGVVNNQPSNSESNSQPSNNVAGNQSSNNTDTNQQSSNTVANQQSNNAAGNQQSNSGATSITVEEAKQIALNHANLTSDQVSFIKAEIDLDDGIKKYDIEFYHQNKEYDYEINANNGQIIGYDYDVENYTIQNNQTSNSAETLISAEEAKQIALKHANLTSSQVSFVKSELDFDDGIQKYDIEFYYNNMEYNYEIDANTGNILQYDLD